MEPPNEKENEGKGGIDNKSFVDDSPPPEYSESNKNRISQIAFSSGAAPAPPLAANDELAEKVKDNACCFKKSISEFVVLLSET